MGTTLYLHPLGGELVIEKTFSGEFSEGNNCINVFWENKKLLPNNKWVHGAMMNLMAKLALALPTATPLNPVKIVGHSGGGQAIMKTIREKRPEIIALLASLGKTSACIEWYILGCPEQKWTGTSYLYPDQDGAVYPGDPAHGGVAHVGDCPTPPEFHGGYGVGYGLPPVVSGIGKINVVSLEYDGWSDAPVNRLHAQLTKLYKLLPPSKVWDFGIFAYLKSSKEEKGGPHGRYDISGSLGLDSDEAFEFVDADGVSYWWIRTYPFPGYDQIKWHRAATRDLDKKYRVSIDTAYARIVGTDRGRPILIPPPDYNDVPTWFPLS